MKNFSGQRNICSKLIIFSLGLASSSAMAIELQDFVADSISAHPQVREQVHIFRQTIQDKTIATSGWRPSIDLLASVSKIDGERPIFGGTSIQESDYTTNNTELSVTQNLFNGFDTKYRIKQAEARIRSALFQLYDTADNIALEAAQGYLNTLKQKRLLVLAEENLASHKETLSKIRKRSNSGAGRRSQLEQTEGRVARAGASLVAQQNNLQDALTRLHEILGRYIDPETMVEPQIPVFPKYNLGESTDQALIQHPAIKVASYNIEVASHEQSRSKSNRYPKIDLRLSKEIGNDINDIEGKTDNTEISLNLEYNFYSGGADRADERKKISAIHEKQQFLARARRQVINTLRLAWKADESLNEQLTFLKKHVVKSRETTNSYQEEFFIGQRDLVDLLDAKNELNSAQNRYTEAYYDALAARFRIYEGTGELFQVLNLNPVVEKYDLRVARIQAKGKDKLPLNPDYDSDNETDAGDHCDNSETDSLVNQYGCEADAEQTSKILAVDPSLEIDITTDVQEFDAVDDDYQLNQNGVMEVTSEMLLENDLDANKSTLEILSFTQPVNGTLALKINSKSKKELIYRALEGFVGVDTFTYTLVNSRDEADTATVSVTIPPETDIDLNRVHYVNFLFSKSELTESSREKAERIIKKLTSNHQVLVNIYAYTDSIGSEAYNLKLSNKRAQAMRILLTNAGIDSKRIKVYGMGESNPISENETKEGQAINRRGEFHFVLQPDDLN